MRFSVSSYLGLCFGICAAANPLSRRQFSDAVIGQVTEHNGSPVTIASDCYYKSTAELFVRLGRYVLVSREYYTDNPGQEVDYMCGAAAMVTNKSAPDGSTVEETNLLVVGICEACEKNDIQIGSTGFQHVSAGMDKFTGEWRRVH